MRKIPAPLLIVTLVCLLIAPLLLFDIVPFMRGGEIFNWLWPYVPVPVLKAVIFALVISLYIVLGFLVVRLPLARWTLLVALIGSIVLAVMGVWLRYDNPLLELFNRTVSPTVTGPHLLAARIDWQNLDAWHDWTKVMEEYQIVSIHMALSPPGLAMWYGGLNQVLEWSPGAADVLHAALLPNQCHNSNMFHYTHAEWASLWFGMLMPLWVGFTVFPLYGIARRLIGEPHARYVTLLWAVIPTVAMMSPSWNLMYPQVGLWAFWALLHAIEAVHRQGAWARGALLALAAGFLISLITFANLSVVPIILLFGFYTLLDWFHHDYPRAGGRSFARPVWVGVWFGAGLLSIWLIFTLSTGTTFFDILDRAFGKHLNLERPFVPWLWMHFWEWALLGSLPAIALWLLDVFRQFSMRAAHQARSIQREVLPVALFFTMVILLLSNTARGETGRVWLFFTPFAILCAGLWIRDAAGAGTKPALPEMAGTNHFAQHWAWGAFFIAQAALVVALASTWDTMFAPDIRPTPPPPTPYADAVPHNALFADAFRLVGWHADATGNKITLYLNMQAARQLTIPYYFAVLPVAPDGSTPIEAVVWQPNATRYPTTCWGIDQLVGDSVDIYLPQNPQAGDWWLSLVAFPDVNDPLNRLPVTLPDGTQDTQVGLGPVQVGDE